ncbi:methyl-accepting chemotaxis protein [Gracilibacillus ureilyticus]|uniref:Methyl-accepting chemotaxis protein n=1 Tax=Gracilibacillus ureilyticus TaxID=531814 RepID=A0A1H9P947_9BACI|nr:methyl-accepting chemotaxis protein [Gracilibacillus ureilyticus]SER44722.1 methyl-accepting chemotaxis protein [Gracilibacillus ureilyticus]
MFFKKSMKDKHLSIMEQDMVKRNSVVIIALTVTTFLLLLSLTASQNVGTIIQVSIQVIVWSAFTILHFKRSLIFHIQYIAIIGSVVTTTIGFIVLPGLTNFVSVIYFIFLALIYMNNKLSIFTLGYGLLLIIYMFFFQKESVNVDSDSVVIYIINYMLISIIVFSFLRVSDFMKKQTADSRKKTEELLADQEKQKNDLLQLINIVGEKTEFITKNSEQSNIAFKEMGEAFQEISIGSNTQNVSSQNINESIANMKNQLQEMAENTATLTDESVNTKQLSETGQEQINTLTQTVGEFRDEIDAMSQEISQLITNLNETSQFSNTIKEIANQTNLLSLNASIEAARAGEHGKGFAVVANEVRILAEMTTESAEKISEQLNSFSVQSDQTRNKMMQVSERMADSYEQTKETNHSFTSINTAIINLNQLSNYNNTLMENINDTIAVISESTSELAAVSQQSNASIEEITATLDSCLNTNADILESLKQLKATLVQ